MCTCSIFVCRHKNNDMSTLLGHVHTYIPTDRQTDTQAYIHKSIQTYSYTYTWLHMCDVSPLWGGVGGNQGGLDHIYICIYIYINQFPWDSRWGKQPTEVMFTMIFLFSLGLRAALLPAVGGKLGWCQSDGGKFLGLENGFL